MNAPRVECTYTTRIRPYCYQHLPQPTNAYPCYRSVPVPCRYCPALDATHYPLPATRYPLPATRYMHHLAALAHSRGAALAPGLGRILKKSAFESAQQHHDPTAAVSLR